MRLTWQQLGIIASVIWLIVAPSYFHLSQEDASRHAAGGRYQLCMKQHWSTKAGVERCNKDLREALAIAHWGSWAQLGLAPVALAWLVGWGLLIFVRRIRSKPEAVSAPYPQIAKGEDKAERREFPVPWTVEAIEGGFKIVDADKLAIAYVYGTNDPHAELSESMTLDEARRIAANIAKLPKLQ
jgi:hypothetical protein